MAGPVRFDLHVGDLDRARAFYGGLFGWRFAEDEGFTRIIESDAEIGAMLARNAPMPSAGSGPRGAIAIFAVDDLDGAYATALRTGGAEALPPMQWPVGRLAYCEDGEGNLFGMIQRTTEVG
jgi:uncharacterized protein